MPAWVPVLWVLAAVAAAAPSSVLSPGMPLAPSSSLTSDFSPPPPPPATSIQKLVSPGPPPASSFGPSPSLSAGSNASVALAAPPSNSSSASAVASSSAVSDEATNATSASANASTPISSSPAAAGSPPPPGTQSPPQQPPPPPFSPPPGPEDASNSTYSPPANNSYLQPPTAAPSPANQGTDPLPSAPQQLPPPVPPTAAPHAALGPEPAAGLLAPERQQSFTLPPGMLPASSAPAATPDSPTGAESPASGPAASTAIAEAPDALGNPPLPRGDYDTLPRGPAYHPHDYSVMQTVTMLQGSDIWPLPDELRDRLLQHYNDTLTPWPHNLTFINAYELDSLVAPTSIQQGAGRRLLQAGEDSVAVNVTVQAPAANASDIANLLQNTAQTGALQQALAGAGPNVSHVTFIVVPPPPPPAPALSPEVAVAAPQPSSKGIPAGAIGGAVGAVVAVLAAGLLGLGIWTRQRRQANTFMAMSALKSPKRPAEKRTEDSAEDLNLEARGMSKGRAGWPIMEPHLLANGSHSYQQSGPLIPAGSAHHTQALVHHDSAHGNEDLLARWNLLPPSSTAETPRGAPPSRAQSIGARPLERYDSAAEQGQGGLLPGLQSPTCAQSISEAEVADLDVTRMQLARANTSALARNLWQVAWSDLGVQRQIGEGSFGKVYLAKWRETTVAVKVLAGTGSHDEDEQQQKERLLASLEKEASMMAQMRHPNVVLYLGLCLEPPCVVTEYCARGSLSDVLKQANRMPNFAQQLDWSRRLTMALDAAKGMHYLHRSDPPVIHRDLKSPNLLVDRHWRVKVCDFNLSRVMEETAVLSSVAASNPRWLAPEILSGRGYTCASDVYSFGLILWELLTWKLPWHDCGPWQVVALVTEGQQRPDIPAAGAHPGGAFQAFEAYCSLMQDCWAQEASVRPCFAAVIGRVRKLLEEELARKQQKGSTQQIS